MLSLLSVFAIPLGPRVAARGCCRRYFISSTSGERRQSIFALVLRQISALRSQTSRVFLRVPEKKDAATIEVERDLGNPSARACDLRWLPWSTVAFGAQARTGKIVSRGWKASGGGQIHAPKDPPVRVKVTRVRSLQGWLWCANSPPPSVTPPRKLHRYLATS